MKVTNEYWNRDRLLDAELTLRNAQKLWDAQALSPCPDRANEIDDLLSSAVQQIREIRSELKELRTR